MESDLGKLFVGGISWDTDEKRLKEYFGKYGEVIEAVIMRDRVTSRARGFGFVVFADPGVAERVIIEKHVIDGRTVEAKKAVPKDDQPILSKNTSSIHGSPSPGRTKKIFVGGLASSVTENDFKNYFDQFGIITDVVIMYDHNTHRPRGFGFVTYDSEEAVDRVLHRTFHELNGKMVEVKKAVPKELSPGPNWGPILGYNHGLSRAASFLNSYAQGYNMNPLGGYGVRMDGRFNPITNGRSGYSPIGIASYSIDANLEPGLSPSYGRHSNFGNSQGYGQLLSPYYHGNSNRYVNPIGYVGGKGRNDSQLTSTIRNAWGNRNLDSATNTPRAGDFLGSESRSLGVSLVSVGANWNSSPLSSQVGGNVSGLTGGSIGYGIGGGSYGLGGGIGHGRNSGSGAAATLSFASPTGAYERSYGEQYPIGSAYGGSAWQPTTSELDSSRSFDYGLSNIASDVSANNSEGYIGGAYNVSSRKTNRGIVA